MKTLVRFFKYLLPFKSRLFSAGIFTIIVSGLTGVSMWLIKPVMDKVFISKDTSMLYMILWLVPLLWFLRGLAFYGQVYLLQYIAQRVIQQLRNELFSKLMELSHNFYHKNPSAKILARLTNDLQIIQNALLRIPLNIIGDAITTVVLMGILFYLNFKFTLIVLVVFPVVAVPLINFAKKMRSTASKAQKQISEIYHRIHEALTGISIIKSFLQETYEKERFKKENAIFYEHQMKFVKVDARSSPIMEFISAIAISFILWYGATDVIRGVWTTGAFFAFLGAAMSIYRPIKNFSAVNAVLQQTIVSAGRIFDILDEKPQIVESPNAQELRSFSEEIRFKDVSFHYDSKHPVIKNINFTLKKGEKLALIGPSGSGKTTIAHLMLRFYDTTTGEILIDGIDIKNITLASLRKLIALVSQDVILFNDTIKNNILYGKPDASEEELFEAAQKAHAVEFIEKLPERYETIVGERGAKLSGGQKQRIAIARAILKNSPILILDEATSSLDAESERFVADALENLMSQKTVLMIAHRFSTIKNADRILVLEGGKIVEEGKHEELLKHSKIYHKLMHLQLL